MKLFGILICIFIRVDEDLDNKSKRSHKSSCLIFCSMLTQNNLPLMPSPQSSPIQISEDESTQDSCADTSKYKKFLKTFSSLGILHSKINFLFTCAGASLVPKGFKLKWTEQTGFQSRGLRDATEHRLLQTSLDLQSIN